MKIIVEILILHVDNLSLTETRQFDFFICTSCLLIEFVYFYEAKLQQSDLQKKTAFLNIAQI